MVIGKLLNLDDVLERFIFDNICKLVFNVDFVCFGDDKVVGVEFMRVFDMVFKIIL